MRLRDTFLYVNLASLLPCPASAHVSEQGFVLLLPTGAYSAAGVAAVSLTVVALFVLPARFVKGAFNAKPLPTRDFGGLKEVVSVISFLLMGFALYIGLMGPRDPLSNIMPLGFWTVGWIACVSLAGVFGNLWAWMNPWTGIYRLVGPIEPVVALPKWLGLWPVTALLVGFAAFLLADIAPNDPARLALFVGIYWVITFCGLILCGRRWLNQCELGHAIFASYASLAPLRAGPSAGIGLPGWQVITDKPARSAGAFALMLLAVGSFDGLNETFGGLEK